MDNLKFRAWHKEREQYYDVATIDIVEEVVGLALSISGQPHLIPGTRDYINKTYVEVDYVRSQEVIIEQYTGLKDKNGKEIYNGDIVEITFIWDIKEKWYVTSAFNFGQWTWDNISTVEIIGNIHENKELIEEEI